MLIINQNCKDYNYKYSKYICDNCLKIKNQQKYIKYICKIKNQQKKYELENKILVIKEYGGECVCCHEKTIEFLTIDHIGNNGSEERKNTNQGTGSKLYRWLIKNNFPKDNYQLLCFNCNCAKGFFGYCPHQKKLF